MASASPRGRGDAGEARGDGAFDLAGGKGVHQHSARRARRRTARARRARAVLEAFGAARALVRQHLEPVVDVLHPGMHRALRADLAAEPAGDAVGVVDADLHALPSRRAPNAGFIVVAQGLRRKSNASSTGRCSAGVRA